MTNEIENFEDERWKNTDQVEGFKHLATLSLIKGKRVLDIGCGEGILLQLLKDKGVEAVGLDLSGEAIRKCRDKGLAAKKCDVMNEELPFEDKSFDCVVMSDVLEHTFFPSALLASAKRLSDKLVISVPNFNSLPARIQMFRGKTPENNKNNKGHVYWFNLSTLKRLIEENDMEISEIKMNTFWENISLLNIVSKKLLKLFPSIFALSFVVRVSKKV